MPTWSRSIARSTHTGPSTKAHRKNSSLTRTTPRRKLHRLRRRHTLSLTLFEPRRWQYSCSSRVWTRGSWDTKAFESPSATTRRGGDRDKNNLNRICKKLGAKILLLYSKVRLRQRTRERRASHAQEFHHFVLLKRPRKRCPAANFGRSLPGVHRFPLQRIRRIFEQFEPHAVGIERV